MLSHGLGYVEVVAVEDSLAGQKRLGWDLTLVLRREQEAQKMRARLRIDCLARRE
jgi:hypothetical protein